VTRGVLLLHDNASVQVMKSYHCRNSTKFNQLPCSPDMPASDYLLFCKLKKHVDVSFQSMMNLKLLFQNSLRSKTKTSVLQMLHISSLPVKYRKCVDLKEDYIEKW
jgi:hypothetical protein